ncbi:MAG: radical SAM protein [Bacilli bacterium]
MSATPSKLSIVSIIERNPALDGCAAQIFLGATAEIPESISISGGAILDRTNLKIQDGCDNACSYCIIPRARGVPRSRSFGEILRDAKVLVDRGVREIILTGINISKFSTPDGGLVELIDKLNEIPGLLRLRIGSIEPPNFDVCAIVERMGDSSHILAPYLHVSAQSLCDNVLKVMRRKYKVEDFMKIVEYARNRIPDISIGADIICGHPGESDADFAETKSAFLSSPLTHLHVFTFSPRPKTSPLQWRKTPSNTWQETRRRRAAALK